MRKTYYATSTANKEIDIASRTIVVQSYLYCTQFNDDQCYGTEELLHLQVEKYCNLESFQRQYLNVVWRGNKQMI
jgi:hypothetical protein